jgi:hypothetical protein
MESSTSSTSSDSVIPPSKMFWFATPYTTHHEKIQSNSSLAEKTRFFLQQFFGNFEFTKARTPAALDEPIQPPSPDEAVFLLDLDKCAFFGNDANDLGTAFQWTQKSPEDLLTLYRLLLNPSVSETYRKLKQRHQTVRVVIYTMRSDFLLYHSTHRNMIIPIRWCPPWHASGQLYLPPALESADDMLAAAHAQHGLQHLDTADLLGLSKSLERLLIARQVIAEALRLPALPDVVVTAADKDVERTVRHLGYPLRSAFLWDDNPALRGAPRVIHVPPFDRLPSDRHDRLAALLRDRLPAASLPPPLADFLLTAGPADRAVRPRPGGAGGVEYAVARAVRPSSAWRPWPVPPEPAPVSESPPVAAHRIRPVRGQPTPAAGPTQGASSRSVCT